MRLLVNDEIASSCYPPHKLAHAVLAMTVGCWNIEGQSASQQIKDNA